MERRAFERRDAPRVLRAGMRGRLARPARDADRCLRRQPNRAIVGEFRASLQTVSGSVSSGVVTVNVAAGSALGAVGGAALVQASLGSFLASRTGQDAFTALTAVCTHEGCTVTGFQNQNYVCPCHGSMYPTSGSVVTGPATRSLRQFPTQFANNVLTITT